MLKHNKRKVQELHKDYQRLIVLLLEGLTAEFYEDGLVPFITEALRNAEKQREYYAVGRFGDTRRQITWTLDSMHLIGAAIDLAFLDKNNKRKLSYATGAEWQRVGKVVKSIPGLVWGGDWPGIFRDQPHVEWDGRTMGYRPENYDELLAEAQKQIDAAKAKQSMSARIAKFFGFK